VINNLHLVHLPVSCRRRSAGLARVLCLALLLPFGSPAQSNSCPEFRVETAREYMQTVLLSVEGQVSSNAAAQFVAARFYSQLGDKREAERLARLALGQHPARAEVAVFLADLLIREDRMQEAASVLREAVTADPQSKGAHRRLGMVLDRLGDSAAARAAFETAVRSNPSDATARLLLGRMLLSQGDAEAAGTELLQACELDPQSASAFYALFQAQTKLGDEAAAQKNLQRFRELKQQEKSETEAEESRAEANPGDLEAYAAGFHEAIAAQLLTARKLSAAEGHLTQALRISPDSAPPARPLPICRSRTPTGRSQAALERACETPSDDVRTRLNLGTVLLQLHEEDAALVELKHVLAIEPEHPQALNNLCRFYLSTRRQLRKRWRYASDLSGRTRRLPTMICSAGPTSRMVERTNHSRRPPRHAKEPSNPAYRQRQEKLQRLVRPAG
jgi:tetratricopeptide (TPR) repeat protein